MILLMIQVDNIFDKSYERLGRYNLVKMHQFNARPSLNQMSGVGVRKYVPEILEHMWLFSRFSRFDDLDAAISKEFVRKNRVKGNPIKGSRSWCVLWMTAGREGSII
jgi:hypothetical protein